LSIFDHISQKAEKLGLKIIFPRQHYVLSCIQKLEITSSKLITLLICSVYIYVKFSISESQICALYSSLGLIIGLES
jgi:hypothetical protein